MVSCPLLPLSVGTDTPGRRRRPLSTLTSSVNLASSGEPLEAEGLPSADGKEEGRSSPPARRSFATAQKKTLQQQRVVVC